MPTPQGSLPGSLVPSDLWIVLKSSLYTLGAAVLAAAVVAGLDGLIAQVIPDLKTRGIIDTTVAVLLTTVFDAIRKAVHTWLADTRRLATWLVLALTVTMCGVSSASDVAVVLDDSKPGTYLVTVGADGAVAVNPIRVVRPGQTPTPGPTPPPGDPTPFVAEVERQTKAVLSAGGSQTTGAALSSVYSLVADEVAAGRIAPASALPAIKAATDLVMSKQADAAQWTGWRTAIGDSLTILQAQGQLGTKEQVSSALKQVATGISRATGFKTDPRDLVTQEGKPVASVRKDFGILDGIDITKIIELIKLIMELLKLFGGLN